MGQYGHGFNYPRPLFLFAGPGYLRILEPDEMADRLVDRHRWEQHLQLLRLYVKPAGGHLTETWPQYHTIPDDAHMWRVTFGIDADDAVELWVDAIPQGDDEADEDV